VAEQFLYAALPKPRNVLSTVEHERGDPRSTIRALAQVAGPLYPVGRLGFESDGQVLMTE